MGKKKNNEGRSEPAVPQQLSLHGVFSTWEKMKGSEFLYWLLFLFKHVGVISSRYTRGK